MHITFFIGSLNIGGAERQLAVLAKGLAERGHKVKVITIFPGGQIAEDLLSCSEGADIGLLSLWPRRGGNIITRILQLMLSPFILRRHTKGSDILYSMLEIANFIAWLDTRFRIKPRLIWGIRSSNMEGHWKMAIFDKFCAMVSPTVGLVIANSNAGLKDMLACGYKPKRHAVIHNGIDTDRFRFNEEWREKLRSEMGIMSHQRLIGIVGRLTPMKDHPTFLRAAALVARDLENVRFVCVGDGPADYAEKLRALSKELGIEERVIWLGARQDMPAVYSALDLLVSSSYGEGFSNVIAEAMACGVPCVVTDVGDSAEIVGDTGAIVEPRNPHTLVRAISDTLLKIEDIDRNKLR